MRARTLVFVAVLLVGGACSSGGGLQGVSSDKAPAGSPAGASTGGAVTNIPQPGAVATQAPPALPERGPAMPADTISLEELHRQGRTDVLR